MPKYQGWTIRLIALPMVFRKGQPPYSPMLHVAYKGNRSLSANSKRELITKIKCTS
jgi:hypothetical protein